MIGRWLYGAAALLLALLFLILIREPLRGLPPETDLWWMMPAFEYYLEGRSGWEVWAFLLQPAPSYFAFPSHKVALWLLHVLELPLALWSWIAAGFHLANAFLLAWLCRGLRLSWRASVLAGITFLCLFIPFHSILWLPASQHVLTLFTILGTLLAFLATERRVGQGRRFWGLYLLTAGGVVAGSLQNAALVTPLLMGTLILAQPARQPHERAARYLRWTPVFFAASLYPVVSHCFAYIKPLMTSVTDFPLAPGPKLLLLLFFVAGILAAGWAFLEALDRSGRARGIAWFLLGAAAGAGILLIASRDSRQVLLPYHALVPFTTVLASFLNPFASALSIDSASKYHYLPAGVSTANLLLTVGVLVFFSSTLLRRKRGFLLFGVWYATTLLYLLLHRHVASSMPFQVTSRYFLYLTPVFCAAFCPAAVTLYLLLARRLGWRGWFRETGLLLLFAFFWVPNLLAVRVALTRGQLANTFYIYDDLRAVRMIGEDLLSRRQQLGAGGVMVEVEGVEPIAFTRKWNWFVPPEKVEYRLFRQLTREAWGAPGLVRGLRINGQSAWGPPPVETIAGLSTRRYRIGPSGVTGPEGPLGRFSAKFEAGLEALHGGRLAEATELLEAAARERPFLLNYLLTPRGRLSDLSWILEGGDLEDWLIVLGERWRLWSIAPPAKWERVWACLQAELGDYRRCLFTLAYLRWREGRSYDGFFWLSQLRTLERDPEELEALLLQDPLPARDPEAALFLKELRSFLNRPDPLPWRKNDYGFGRWLARILLGWDIRSRWDAQFPEPP